MRGIGIALVLAALVASPALAHKRPARHGVTCKQIKEAVAAGKTTEDVAKDLKVTGARVKACTAPAPAVKRTRHRRAKAA